MQYLLMLYARESNGLALPPEDMERAMHDMGAFQAALEKAGAFVMTTPLARTEDARTLRYDGGGVVRTDAAAGKPLFVNEGGELKVEHGPYADTLEQLGGIYIIEADSLDEAIGWARRCPALQWGSVEVRAMHAGY